MVSLSIAYYCPRILGEIKPSYLRTDADGFDFDPGVDDLDIVLNILAEDDGTTSRESPSADIEIDTDDFRPATQVESSFVTSAASEFSEQVADESDESSQKRPRRMESRSLMAPKVMKNDIRRSFANMFFNAINCGDFQKVQDFAGAFILPTCPFFAATLGAAEDAPPSVLYGLGPRAHIHYLLGCFVMFPDMVATVGDVQIITSNQFEGTKIVIPWDCRMTKTHHIPTECWIPPPDKVEKMYAETSLEGMMAALTVQDNDQIDTFLPPIAAKKRKRARKAPKVPQFIPNRVPESYHLSMLSGAEVVTDTPKLRTQGTYTIMLDANNYVQSIALLVTQAESASQFKYVLPLNVKDD